MQVLHSIIHLLALLAPQRYVHLLQRRFDVPQLSLQKPWSIHLQVYGRKQVGLLIYF